MNPRMATIIKVNANGSAIIQNQPMRSAMVREMASRMNMAYHTLRVTCQGVRRAGAPGVVG